MLSKKSHKMKVKLLDVSCHAVKFGGGELICECRKSARAPFAGLKRAQSIFTIFALQNEAQSF
jgi:hypothetical protein